MYTFHTSPRHHITHRHIDESHREPTRGTILLSSPISMTMGIAYPVLFFLVVLASLASSSSFRVDSCSGFQRYGRDKSELKASRQELAGFAVLPAMFFTMLGPFSTAAWADELGRETEAPTVFTGESVMVSV